MNNLLLKKLLKQLKLNEANVSTLLGLIVILIIGGIVINFFRQNKTTAPGLPANQTVENSEVPSASTPQATTYVVQANDTLWDISQRHYQNGFALVKIAEANNLANPSLIVAVQELTIPSFAQTDSTASSTIEDNSYTVAKGDSLWTIAVRAYGDGYQWSKIAQANNLHNPNLIHPGNKLQLPRYSLFVFFAIIKACETRRFFRCAGLVHR